jgi:hypothetical protein
VIWALEIAIKNLSVETAIDLGVEAASCFAGLGGFILNHNSRQKCDALLSWVGFNGSHELVIATSNSFFLRAIRNL